MGRNVYDLFRTTAAARPDALAARHPAGNGWRDVTWGEVARTAERVAAGLAALDVRPGDRVAILSHTRVEWTAADLGVIGAGAVTVPIYQSNLASDCEYILRDAGCVLAFAEDEAQLAKLRAVRGRLPGLRTIVAFEDAPAGEAGILSWETLLARGDAWLGQHAAALDERGHALGPESLLTIIYTSGTTGPPKGAMLTHDCMLYEAEAVRRIGIVDPADVVYLFLPLAHVFAKVVEVAWLSTGCVLAYWRRDPKRIVEDVAEIRPTIFPAVPRIFEKIHARVVEDVAAAPGVAGRLGRWALAKEHAAARAAADGRAPFDPGWALARALVFRQLGRRLAARLGGRLRFAISGGAPLAPEIAWFFHHAGLEVCEGYGLTETSGASTVNLPGQVKPGTVGPPVPGTEIRIADDGEVLLRGRGVMRGYWRREAETREVIDADGWFRTGDIGCLDADGCLRITDRKKDIIVTAGGKNVAPQNIETALKSASPLVSQVVVHGDAQKYLTALVTLDPDALAAWARAHGVAERDHAALTRRADVRTEVERAVEAVNRDLPSHERVCRIDVLDHDFEVGDQLTPTMKVKRKLCIARYRDRFEAMYAEDRSRAAS